MAIVCYILVFLSGFTGLVYQVTWQKYLSVMLGSHASSSAIVLALFFLFLSLGYALLSDITKKLSSNNFLIYGFIELIIGLYAFYSPGLFNFIFDLYNLTQISSPLMASILYSSLFLFVPTVLMGGTIPVLVQGLSASYSQSSRVHAKIYSINTIGAFFGCLMAGFMLIEQLGLADTLFVAGWINIFIFLIALIVVIKNKNSFQGPAVEVSSRADEVLSESFILKNKIFVLSLISFCSGFYIFCIEKIIIRMAGLIYGSSAYSYTIVVAAFILAIACGGFFIARHEEKLSTSRGLAITLGLSLLLLVALYLFIPIWPTLALRTRLFFSSSLINFNWYWLAVLVSSLAILILPIGLLGMNLPILFSHFRSSNESLLRSVGRLYSINSVGSALGAVFGGYFLFNYFSASQIFLICIGLLFLVACMSIFLIDGLRSFKIKFGVYLIFILSAVIFIPKWQATDFVPGRHNVISISPYESNLDAIFNTYFKNINVLFEKYDPNTLVHVTQINDIDRILYVNGKADAMTTGDQNTRALAALTPIALSPIPVKKVFIAGLGAGLSTAVASGFSEVEKIDVAEISSGVIEALPYFSQHNFDIESRMRKINLETGDAYKVLMQKKYLYDLIICEPSNPWVSGVEKLFSIEFYNQVSKKLSPQGLFAQWFPLFSIDPATFSIILNTYSKVFKWVYVWSATGGAITIIGSQNELKLNFDLAESRYNEQKAIYNKFKILSPASIYYLQLLSPGQVQLLTLNQDEIHSVYAPLLEFRAGRGHFANLSVDLSDLLFSRGLLPLPKALDSYKWPIWYKDGLKFDFASFESALILNMPVRAYLYRNLLLALPQLENKKLLTSELAKISDLILLSGVPSNLGKIGEINEKNIELILTQIKQLNSIGFLPKISHLTNEIDKKCQGGNKACYSMKLAFLKQLSSKNDFLELNLSNPQLLSQAEKDKVDRLYSDVILIYKSMNSF